VNAPDHAAAVFTDRTRDPAITDRKCSSRHATRTSGIGTKHHPVQKFASARSP
jgi:excisionase family DNA binding protein